jgi:hypothetical protein
VDENFLKRIITGDETWVYGYDNAIFTMGWKKSAETEKVAAGHVERESNVDVSFWHRGCCARRIIMSGANNESLVLSRSADTYKRKCQEKETSVVEKQRLVPPS